MYRAALFALCTLAMPAIAQDDWIHVASATWGDSFIQPGSFVIATTKGGDEIAVVVGKNVEKKDGTVDLGKWYVRTEHCTKRQGKIVTLNIDGDYRFENDFVYGAGSVASRKAEMICSVLALQNEERRKKSL